MLLIFHTLSALRPFFVLSILLILKDGVKDSPLNSNRRLRSVSAPTEFAGGSLYHFFFCFKFFKRKYACKLTYLFLHVQQEMTLIWLVNELVSL